MAVVYADAEALAKAWLVTTAVAPLVTRTDGGLSIYMSMPTSAPNPAIIVTRVGGSPRIRGELPEDYPRLSFTCWGKSRQQAGDIARALASALDALAGDGGFVQGAARLVTASVINVVWLPDPESDTPRYIVDARVLTLHA